MGVPFKAKNGLDANSNKIVNVSNPTAAQDAATKLYVDNAVGTGLPSQAGNSGKFLTTNATTASWSLVPVAGINATGTPSITTYLRGDGTWATVASGSGDVVGPASSTDNAVVRFDGTTGKLIQNSTAASIDDSGNADFLSTKSDYFDIDTTATTTTFAAGRTLWNAANKTASLCFDSGSVQADLGQAIYAYVTNADSTTINLGDAVYLFGATGNRASVKKASSSSESTSSKTLGLAAQSIAANATGMVITQGTLGGLSLGSYTAGDTVYLGTTAGTITNVKPSAPTNLVVIGVVERANNGNGQILVKVQNGFELSELHDVLINGTLASGNTLIYDATALLWKNASLTAGTGISVTNGAASITIANTGVTSVTGTSPVVSSGGTTPAISLASGYGDTQNPYGSKTANYVLAAPNGSAGVPTFRAIVAADIPTLNQNTTGSAGSVPASGITGSTLASGVTASSLTSVGTLTGLTVSGTTSLATSSGNVGIGTTPSAWSGIVVAQFKGGFVGSQSSSYLYTGQNTYFNGTNFIYSTTAAVTMLEQSFGAFMFYRAASGTAGNTVSFSESMRIDTSGNLLVGVTSASYSSANRGVAILGGSASGLLGFQIGGVAKGYVAHFDTSMQIWNEAASPILFGTSATERVRIDSSGNVGIGTASPSFKLDVNGTGNFNGVLSIASGTGTSGANQGLAIYQGSDASGYGRIRFYENNINNATIHNFSSTWQNGSSSTINTTSTGCINLDGPYGVTIGGWNGPTASFNRVSGLSTFNGAVTITGALGVTGLGTFSAGIQANGNSMFFNGQTSALSVENQSTFTRFAFNKLTFYDWNVGRDIVILDNAVKFQPNHGSTKLQDDTGVVINGNYTNGAYSTRFRKWDDGSGLPLYVQETKGTPNVWTNVARFGQGEAGQMYDFQVFGNTKIDTNLDAGGSITASVNLTGVEIYSNGWFRNNNSGTGLYNSATGNHFYSDGQYWNCAYSGTQGIRFRNGHAGAVLGYLYAETSGYFGLLNNQGNWSLMSRPNGAGITLYGTEINVAQTLYVHEAANRTRVPRTFVQTTAPGGTLTNGDIWIQF